MTLKISTAVVLALLTAATVATSACSQASDVANGAAGVSGARRDDALHEAGPDVSGGASGVPPAGTDGSGGDVGGAGAAAGSDVGGASGSAGASGRGGASGTAEPGVPAGAGGNGGASGVNAGDGGTPAPEDDGDTGSGSSSRAILSGVPWFDTDGNLVNAHGVGFIKVDSTYYMVGEQRSGLNDTYTGAPINGEDTFTGISMYSTTNFADWKFVGTVVKPIPGTVLRAPYYGERPKILYNASSKKYVIYIKALNYVGNPPDYVGYYTVLTSSDIAGPYAYQGNLSPTGANDFNVFEDSNGAQYLARHQGTLYKLSADGLSIGSTVQENIQSGESPALFKAGSTYFYLSSKGTYWYSNDNSYSTAPSVTGPWTGHGFFCPSGSKTWQSQSTDVVTVSGSSGSTYVYVGDRWTNGELSASTLVVQPMTLNGSTTSIPTYHPAWKVDTTAGTWTDVPLDGTSINDDDLGTGTNQFVYGTGWARGTVAGCYQGDAHSSSTAGALATVAFTGTRALLYSAYSGSAGIMGITLQRADGTTIGPEVHVSLRYDAPAAGNYLVYASPVQPKGAYQLKVRVTGKKDLYSSSPACNIDRVVILGGN